MFDKKVQEMLTEIMFEEKAEETTLDLYGSADDVYGKEDYKQGFKDGAKFGYNEKYSEFENELKWERETKAELAEHLGKANDKVADLEETINKLREQLALRYDLEDKIKELEEANKTNEWHYVKDGDLPKNENDVLVYSGEEWRMCVGRYSPKHKAWEAGCDAIAWKEIVLPELKESE